jgi:DNA-directed RNA polymerase subunit RPC12/RpoP
MANINKVCEKCGKRFDFTTSEQNYYRDKGFADPKKCPTCIRAAKLRARSTNPTTESISCLECNERLVRGVIVDSESNCYQCGRHIEKSVKQYPVLHHSLRGQDGRA